MFGKFHLGLIAATLAPICFAQNSTLIDPRTRFSNLNLSLPAPAWPNLQTDFTVPPDCGETSYHGTGRLRGRKALVTGGDSGIGRAIVIAYAREGASIAINYLPKEEPDAQDLADFLSTEGLNITRIPGDLLDEKFCGDLVHQANEALGGLDIVVNNAGYPGISAGPDYRPITNHSTSQFDKIFRTNVYAGYFITRAASSLLPPGSSVIFTASDLARLPQANGFDYAASKAAIVGLMRGLSGQLQPLGIRTNAVAPGLTYTPMLASTGMTTESLQETAPFLATPRIEQPVELSPLYVDLAATDKTYVTGSVFGANGGGLGF